jgi:kinesin family protein 18/19
MIVCVSPSSAHFDETQNTLRYANRAKNIQTKVTRNVYNVNRHVKDFLVKIDEQMALINELKAQQKDSEGAAFVKFRKQNEKRDGISREGILRIRAAFDHSASERQEKANSMKKLRQIERRIGILSAWVAAFDSICDSREDEEMPPSLAAMRKTAQGILLELENSRQHYHQRLDKSNWERAIDSALQNSIRQLTEVDGCSDGLDVASLTREAELLKANAGREALLEVLEQEKVGDAGVMQVLLSAQFDIISSLSDILSMSEEDAIQHAKTVLRRLLQTCSTAVSQVIKPDGSLNVTEVFPPTKRGTPKRKKPAAFFDGQSKPPVMAALAAVAPQVYSSPMKSSPRRRKAVMGKKGVSFTPKKKSPSKRSVRWRDDTESGALADFEKTPQKMQSTSEASSGEQSIVLPTLPSYLAGDVSNDSLGSSPTPSAPEPSIELKPKANRFQAGFLSKKSDGSPPPPRITELNSSDTDPSPLRTMDAGNVANRSSLHIMDAVDITPTDSGNNSSSESENWQVNRSESAKIGMALKRAGSISRASHSHSISDSARTQRRRSPTAATMAGSPPNENMFTASHARRMVTSQKEGAFQSSVLSPRSAPVMKSSNRRTTIGETRQASGTGSHAVRLSGTIGSTPKSRESVAGFIGKSGWR